MPRTLDYARRRPPESAASTHYAALPAWVFQVNAVAAAAAWGTFAVMWTDLGLAVLLLFLAGWGLLFAHAFFVALPSLGAIILAERIDPRERRAAAALTLVGLAGTAACVLAPGFDWRC